MNRKAYGFEIKKKFHMDATKWIKETQQRISDIKEFGFAKRQIEKQGQNLFSC